MQNKSKLAGLADPLTLGDVTLPNRVLLAPMSGVTDRPFRKIAAAFGAGAVVSEMIAGDQLAREDPVASAKAERAGAGPHIIQLAGREPRWMAEGARAATAAGADVIDINMGCPAKKVTGGYSGSALMRDLDHATRLIEATIAATDRPVTLKMRLGWDDANRNAAALARRAEKAGIAMLTVHGRTRCQFYTGTADWRAIGEVKAAVDIPVIANGDVRSTDDLGRLLLESGADGVMIGRGAYGRPWLPGQLAGYAAGGAVPTAPAHTALGDLVVQHYCDMLGHYGQRVGLRAARKHLAWYLDRAREERFGVRLRASLLTETNPAAVIGMLRDVFAGPAAVFAT